VQHVYFLHWMGVFTVFEKSMLCDPKFLTGTFCGFPVITPKTDKKNWAPILR
jgi:hypothetical protein